MWSSSPKQPLLTWKKTEIYNLFHSSGLPHSVIHNVCVSGSSQAFQQSEILWEYYKLEVFEVYGSIWNTNGGRNIEKVITSKQKVQSEKKKNREWGESGKESERTKE